MIYDNVPLTTYNEKLMGMSYEYAQNEQHEHYEQHGELESMKDMCIVLDCIRVWA